jgi:hypothetical protein
MRKVTLSGLAVVGVSLLFGLTAPFAQRSEDDPGKATSTMHIVAVEALGVCSLDNQVTTMGSELPFDSKQLFSATASGNCVPRSQCCKICSKGKACGDTCIRSDYTCHKGKGCACNQGEVCKS